MGTGEVLGKGRIFVIASAMLSRGLHMVVLDSRQTPGRVRTDLKFLADRW